MSTPTTRGKYRKLALGEGLQTWGLQNGLNGLFDQMDAALHGHNLITLSSTSYTLSSTNYTASDINYRFIKFAGTPGGTATINIPATENWWLVQNSTGETLTFTNGANSANLLGTSAFYGIVISDGTTVDVLTLPDGVNVSTIAPEVSNGNIASIAAQIANSNIPNLAAAAVITSMNALSPQAVRDDMAALSVQAVIDDMAMLAVQTVLDDMAALAVTSVLTDMSLLSPAGVRSDMAALAVSSVITNMAAINTGTVITDMAAVVAGTVRTDMAAINSGTTIADLAALAPASVRSDMSAINTGTVISDMAAIIAGSVRTDMAAINSGTVISDMSALNTGTILADISGVNAISNDVSTVADTTYKSQIQTLATAPLPTDIATVAGIDAAVSSVANSENSINSFGKSYSTGAGTINTRGDGTGSSPATGDLRFNQTTSKMLVYDGGSWIAAGSAVNATSERHTYTATANQTTFPASGSISYDAGFIDCFLNGVKLVNGVDVNVTSGTNVVLTTGAAAGDVLDLVAYGAFSDANMYTKSAADARFYQNPAVADLDMGATASISNGVLRVKNQGSQSQLALYCEVGNAHAVILQSPPHASFSGTVTLTLPPNTGTVGQLLQTDGNGVMTWGNAPAGSSIASTLKFA